MLVDKNNVIKRVQVKSTGCKTKYGNYQLALKSCGGTKGSMYKTVIETNIDELFVLTEDLKMYIIPKEKINNKSTLNLYDKYEKYRVY